MSHFSTRQKLIMAGTPLIVVSLIYLFPALTNSLGIAHGSLIAFAVYWGVVCIGIGSLLIGPLGLKHLYTRPKNLWSKANILNILLTLLPVVLVFVAAFIPTISTITPRIMLLATLFAIINGTAEELFWRGVFLRWFPQDIRFAIFYPLVLFTTWHIALALIKGVHYQAGVLGLIGGAAIMGLVWAILTWRTKSIYLSTLSHIGVNMLAFPTVLLGNS